MTKAQLEALVVAWRTRWDWNGRWPTENERLRAIQALEAAADEIIQRPQSREVKP